MGFKIKNSLTGEFEKLPILTLKGEKGETGGVEEYNKVDYMGNKYETLKQANDANVEYAVKTAIGEFNYLDYDGQHITALDTLAGQAKNAVVEGQTLVNIANKNLQNKEKTATNDSTSTNYAFLFSGKGYELAYPLIANKKYLIIEEWNIKSSNDILHTAQPKIIYEDDTIGYFNDNGNLTTLGVHKLVRKFIPEKNVKNFYFGLTNKAGNTISLALNYAMIIEYQEGMENWDIPYFEGMTSVKMPVLTTTGKNLFNPRWLSNSSEEFLTIESDGSVTLNGTLDFHKWFDFTLPEGTYYPTCSFDGIHAFWNGGDNCFHYEGRKITLNETTTIKGYISSGTYDNVNFTIQVEEGSVATSYEPYKSNILSCLEPVELREIGNVKDTLDVTKREDNLVECTAVANMDTIGVNWNIHPYSNDEYLMAYGTLDSKGLITTDIICDKLPTWKSSAETLRLQTSNYVWGAGGTAIYIWLNRNLLSEQTPQGLNEYFTKNRHMVVYKLKEKVVKTVDLSDNHVYSYKDVTHYDCSSAEGSLVPTLSVKVPTDVQATIAQQRETIQTLNSENERLNQIQEALKASMLDSQVQLMNLSWDIDFEVFTLRESIAPKDFPMVLKTGSNIDKFSQAKFIIENDCPDLEKLNSQIEYYFSKDVFSQEQFEELTDLISIVKGGNGCEY